MGNQAGYKLAAGSSNTFIGKSAGEQTVDATENTAMGKDSLKDNQSGNGNTAIGVESLSNLQSGSENVGVGKLSGFTGTTFANNTFVGYQAGRMVTGTSNTYLGHTAGRNARAGGENVAIGKEALLSGTNSDAANNVAIGVESMKDNSTGTQNTVIGKAAGQQMSTADSSVVIGAYAAQSGSMSGNKNVIIGHEAGRIVSTGYENVIIGQDASEAVAGGFRNVHIGKGCAETTTSVHGQVIIGWNCDASGNASEQTVLGYNNSGYSGGWFTVVDPDGKSYINPGSTSWSGTSDAGYKENIETSTAGLSFINDLRPVTFTYRKKKDIDRTLQGYTTDAVDGEKYYKGDSSVNHGFIAQEVKTVLDNHPEVKDGHKIWRDKEPDQFYEEDKDAVLYTEEDDIPEGKSIGDIRKLAQVKGELRRLGDGQSIAEGEMIPMLVKSIQELSAKNDVLEARIKTLEDA